MTLLEEVLMHDDYVDLGGFSATTFNKPTYQVHMEKKYGRIDESPEDRVASQVGTGFHALAEKIVTSDDYILEDTLQFMLNEYLITGTPDIIDKVWKVVQDWKVKGPYQFQKTFRGEIDDLIRQLSIYRWLYFKVSGEHLDNIGKGHIVCAGWQKNTMRIQKKHKEDYPDLEFYPKYTTVDVPLMSYEDTEEMMLKWIERYEMQSIMSNIDCDTSWACEYCLAKCVHNVKYKGE